MQTRPNHEDRTVERIKQYGFVFDKRVIDKDTFMSYPYWYKRL